MMTTKKKSAMSILILTVFLIHIDLACSESAAAAAVEEPHNFEELLPPVAQDPEANEVDEEMMMEPDLKHVGIKGKNKRARRDILILSMGDERVGPCPADAINKFCYRPYCPAPNPCICRSLGPGSRPRCASWNQGWIKGELFSWV